MAFAALTLTTACGAGEAAVDQAVLFSALDGKLVREGKPVAGATIIREWDFAEDRVHGIDRATTDMQGRFQFPPVLHSYQKARFLPQQAVVTQLIKVQLGDAEWRVWAASKHDLKAGTEAVAGPADGTDPGVPLDIVVDLDSPMALRGQVAGHTIFGTAP
ncbi:hypothetical protein GCM10007973_01760 [Polymorphobacter multimanifer]|uniref:DUF6795 domain-containing protein n=1 Tax=Polymorphobacter multimanifer TaxID=1070431 RepID=A0A841L7C2_9SPHN|nr:DUF6795 domain-containing protein [Polymorphobacter multimanifer]MBB6227481.1 hypothetical protein [Polymorphobacter multimanifer]GGI68348.1 hypothetical protein GCM10007973_01760 [Polymorphobacter multimanifer]